VVRRFLWPGQSVPLNQQNILPAVAIIVQEGASGTEGFWQEFSAEGSAVVLELDSRRAGHIGESKPWGRRCSSLPHDPSQPRRQLRPRSQSCQSPKERPAIHGTFTSPARMAYTTSSAVL